MLIDSARNQNIESSENSNGQNDKLQLNSAKELIRDSNQLYQG